MSATATPLRGNVYPPSRFEHPVLQRHDVLLFTGPQVMSQFGHCDPDKGWRGRADSNLMLRWSTALRNLTASAVPRIERWLFGVVRWRWLHKGRTSLSVRAHFGKTVRKPQGSLPN